MADKKPEIGDYVLVIFDEGSLLYNLVQTDPQMIANNEEEQIDLIRINRQWKVLGFLQSHIVLIILPASLRDNAKCSRKYKGYKKVCNPLWNIRVESGESKEYYRFLIRELRSCLDQRADHMTNCGITDAGHAGAIIKIKKILKLVERELAIVVGTEIEELDIDVSYTLSWWNNKENGYLTQFLMGIPYPVLMEFLHQNQPCVEENIRKYFGDVYPSCSEVSSLENCSLSRERLVYILLKIYEGDPNKQCLDIDELLNPTNKRLLKIYEKLRVRPYYYD